MPGICTDNLQNQTSNEKLQASVVLSRSTFEDGPCHLGTMPDCCISYTRIVYVCFLVFPFSCAQGWLSYLYGGHKRVKL